MSIISLKDYASEKGISYEAVRKQVNRYRKDLGEHIIKKGKTQFLDKEAVSFLDAKRKENPVVVVESNKNEEIERLKAERDNLLLKVAQLQDELLREKDNVKVLQAEKIALLEERKPEQQKKRWQFWK